MSEKSVVNFLQLQLFPLSNTYIGNTTNQHHHLDLEVQSHFNYHMLLSTCSAQLNNHRYCTRSMSAVLAIPLNHSLEILPVTTEQSSSCRYFFPGEMYTSCSHFSPPPLPPLSDFIPVTNLYVNLEMSAPDHGRLRSGNVSRGPLQS